MEIKKTKKKQKRAGKKEKEHLKVDEHICITDRPVDKWMRQEQAKQLRRRMNERDGWMRGVDE